MVEAENGLVTQEERGFWSVAALVGEPVTDGVGGFLKRKRVAENDHFSLGLAARTALQVFCRLSFQRWNHPLGVFFESPVGFIEPDSNRADG